MWRRFFHATLSSRVPAIIDGGLDPLLSQGRRPVVWLVDSKRVHWAIAHVALRHKVQISDIWLATVHIDPRELYKFRWPGVFLCPRTIEIYDIFEASTIINAGPNRFAAQRS